VTGDIYSEAWTYEVHGDISYLKADQVTTRGENKIIFSCSLDNVKNHVPIMMILSELPHRERIVREWENIILFINDTRSPVATKDVFYPPQLTGDSYLSWAVVAWKKAHKFAASIL
jgi:hypothetical protein